MIFENNKLPTLKPSDKSELFMTYDIETIDWNKFLMGGVYDGKQYNHFTSLTKMCQYILRKKYTRFNIYAHYGGGFDHRFILDYVFKERPELKVQIIEAHGLIIGLKIQTSDKKLTWRFLDSYQVIKGGLKDLTQIFDVKHKKLDADRKNIRDTPKDRLYLKHDVIGLYEVIEKFYSLDILQGVGHRLTTSSLAMSVFRMKYLKDTVLYKLPPNKEAFVRSGYYGGRVEVFKMIAHNVREYDVNSMYVSAMLKPLPCGSQGIWAKGYDFNDENTVAFIECEVKTPGGIHLPMLPFRTETKLIFPKGKFSGVYFSEEIKAALSAGYEININKALVFPASPFLAEYARDTWEIRSNNPGKNPLSTTAKLLGNGLYGKFAQKRERAFISRDIEFIDGCEKGYTLINADFNLWKIPTFSNTPAILPQISAAITAYARIRLYDFLSIYPEKVVYCDTDSVFIEDEKLPEGKGLGELKFENHYAKFAAIQPKFYIGVSFPKVKEKTALNFVTGSTRSGGQIGQGKTINYVEQKKDKLRAKGFVDEGLNWIFEDFTDSLTKNNYSVFFQQQEQKFSKLNESLRAKDLLYLVARKRGVKSVYDKRIINPDWTTSPVEIKEG